VGKVVEAIYVGKIIGGGEKGEKGGVKGFRKKKRGDRRLTEELIMSGRKGLKKPKKPSTKGKKRQEEEYWRIGRTFGKFCQRGGERIRDMKRSGRKFPRVRCSLQEWRCRRGAEGKGVKGEKKLQGESVRKKSVRNQR